MILSNVHAEILYTTIIITIIGHNYSFIIYCEPGTTLNSFAMLSQPR